MTRAAASLVRDFFLAPERAAPAEHAAPPAPVVVALGDTRTLPSLACAAALELAHRSGCDHAAVCLWPSACAPGSRAPAAGAARRAAVQLESRGCDADASGWLVRVRLPDAPSDAAVAAQRVVAAIDCPVVLGLAGSRTDEIDGLFAVADTAMLVRLPGDPPALTRLAEAGLARLGVPVVVCEGRLGAAARLLAMTGLLVPPAARSALAPLGALLQRSRVDP